MRKILRLAVFFLAVMLLGTTFCIAVPAAEPIVPFDTVNMHVVNTRTKKEFDIYFSVDSTEKILVSYYEGDAPSFPATKRGAITWFAMKDNERTTSVTINGPGKGNEIDIPDVTAVTIIYGGSEYEYKAYFVPKSNICKYAAFSVKNDNNGQAAIEKMAPHTEADGSVTMAGIGLGGTIFSPIVTNLLQNYGWRHTYLIMAGIILVVALPVASMYDLNGSYTLAWMLLLVLTAVTLVGWVGSYTLSKKFCNNNAEVAA